MIFGLARLGDQRAGDERAERDRVAESARQQREREADADAGDHAWSRGGCSRTTARIRRGTISTRRPAADQEAGQLPMVSASALRRSPAPDATAVSDRQQQDRDQVLDDQDAEDELAQAARILCSANALAMIVVLEIAITRR